MIDKIKQLLENAEQSDAIARNKWRIENREQLRKERKEKLKELMEKDKQKTAITSLIILIGIIIICIGVVNSKVISIAVMAIPVLVFTYFCIYSTILRNKKQ
jgi:Flp pilus assembly protein TadB